MARCACASGTVPHPCASTSMQQRPLCGCVVRALLLPSSQLRSLEAQRRRPADADATAAACPMASAHCPSHPPRHPVMMTLQACRECEWRAPTARQAAARHPCRRVGHTAGSQAARVLQAHTGSLQHCVTSGTHAARRARRWWSSCELCWVRHGCMPT